MAKRRKMPSFTLQLPELSTRRVWVGIYSEMTGTVVMIFSEKPAFDTVLKEYSVLDERHIASVWIDEWEHWFGSVQPFVDSGLIEYRGDRIGWVSIPELDCHKVIQIDLTTSWNDNGLIVGLNTNADN